MPGVTVGDHPRRGGTGKPPAPDPGRDLGETCVRPEKEPGTMVRGMDVSRRAKSDRAHSIAQR